MGAHAMYHTTSNIHTNSLGQTVIGGTDLGNGCIHGGQVTFNNVHTNSLGQTVIGGYDLGNGCIVGGQVVHVPPSELETSIINAISTAVSTAWNTRNDPPKPGQRGWKEASLKYDPDVFWSDLNTKKSTLLDVELITEWDGRSSQCEVKQDDSVAACLQRELRLPTVKGLSVRFTKGGSAQTMSVHRMDKKKVTFQDLGLGSNTRITVIRQALACVSISKRKSSATQQRMSQLQLKDSGRAKLDPEPGSVTPDSGDSSEPKVNKGDRRVHWSEPVGTDTSEDPFAPAVPIVGFDPFAECSQDPFAPAVPIVGFDPFNMHPSHKTPAVDPFAPAVPIVGFDPSNMHPSALRAPAATLAA